MRNKTKLIALMLVLSFLAFYLVLDYSKNINLILDETRLLNQSVTFKGIQESEKDVINVIVVHGIGTHCIGYADKLISNLNREFGVKDYNNSIIDRYYNRYLKAVSKKITNHGGVDQVLKDGGGAKIFPPRNGSCEIDNDSVSTKELVTTIQHFKNEKAQELVDKHKKIEWNRGFWGGIVNMWNSFRSVNEIDLNAVIASQEEECEYINQSDDINSTTSPRSSCYKIFVNKEKHLLKKVDENPEYITGFVRRVTSDLSSKRQLRIFEVTWSPSTRWLKRSYLKVEQLNEESSIYYGNNYLKGKIINNAIADAVAYLSDAGILVNHNILQTFCLSLIDPKQGPPPVKDARYGTQYKFSCNKNIKHLATENFDASNDVFLISHSLGTRVMFDTLGLLSRGLMETTINEKTLIGSEETTVCEKPTEQDNLIHVIAKEFGCIGADVDDEYFDYHFASMLRDKTKEFIRSINTIYVFTNQIPLLSANITTPLDPLKQNVSNGFSEIFQVREGLDPMQIISFHDPDDMLSYDLRCWYHLNILRNLETTAQSIEEEALSRNGLKGEECELHSKCVRERSQIFHSIFNSCYLEEDHSEYWVYQDILRRENNLNIDLVDARVRLKNINLPLLLVNPSGVHSNYFEDELIHHWLYKGH